MATLHRTRPLHSPIHTVDNDPLFGIQQTTDSPAEAAGSPPHEVILKPLGRGAPAKSRVVAGVLGLLFGGVGAHRFYLGYPEVGTAQAAAFILLLAVGLSAGYALGLSSASAWATALSAAIIVPLWGALEGVLIFAGMMRLDGQGRPMR